MAKTIKLGNYAALDDNNLASVLGSVNVALTCLSADADREGREVIWGTLEIEVQNDQIEDVQIVSNVIRVHSNTRVVVSALAVRK